MTADELIGFIAELDAVETVVASVDSGAPESAWGDVFFSIPGQRLPFATIVFRDQPGFDESSRLDRDGIFRLNVAVGREVMRQRFGADHAHDPAALDRLFPIRSMQPTAGSVCSTPTRRPTRSGSCHRPRTPGPPGNDAAGAPGWSRDARPVCP